MLFTDFMIVLLMCWESCTYPWIIKTFFFYIKNFIVLAFIIKCVIQVKLNLVSDVW